MIDMRRLNLRSTAFHEAGHAVDAVLKGIAFSKVWILKRKDTDPVPQNVELGQLTRVTPIDKLDFVGKVDEAKVEAIQAFAGPIAECLAYPGMQPDFQLNIGDYLVARSILRFATTPFTLTDNVADFAEADLKRTEAEVNGLLDECFQSASRLVNGNIAAISRVADALLDSWELTPERVAELCQ